MAKLARSVRGEKSARSAISKVCRRERRRSAQNLVGRPGRVRGRGKDRQDLQPLLRCHSNHLHSEGRDWAAGVTSVPHTAHTGRADCGGTQRNDHTP